MADKKSAPASSMTDMDKDRLLHELQVHQIELEMQIDELQKTQLSISEKETLLKEIHHRVKNNLAVVASLLNLQSHNTGNDATRAILEESSSRIKSISLIHEKLYEAHDLSHIAFKKYLQRLAGDIKNIYKRNDVDLLIEMEDISLDVTAGIPCGLIFNELISNSIKHAFPDGRGGEIKIGVNKNGKGEYVLFVEDNGKGFPPEIDFLEAESMGLNLVNILAKQLGGKLELSTQSGTRFSVTFPNAIH